MSDLTPTTLRSRRPKDIGTAAETAVVRYLQSHGFPHAERRALRGAYDCGDITGTPGICWEVKGGKAAKTASAFQVAAWMEETERERQNANAAVGILVVQRSGVGAPNAHLWWAIVPLFHLRTDRIGWRALTDAPVRLHLQDLCLLLRHDGYGDPIEAGA